MTNNQIKTAFYGLLNSAALGYEISWPSVNFKPPSTGSWLEVMFFPNESLDNGLAYDSATIARGIFQVSCVTRPGAGTVALGAIAEQIRTTFAKGTIITGSVRVIREPYDIELEAFDDRVKIVVSVEYSG
jgi:hypothetical protein